MSEKRRSTVTTIETHEVWVIRKAGVRSSEAVVSSMPLEIQLEPAIPPGEQVSKPKEEEENTK